MDFLLRNKIYLLPVVLVALMFGYFFYYSFGMGLLVDDLFVYSNWGINLKYIIKSHRLPLELFTFLLGFDFKGNDLDKYFITSIFMSSIFFIFMYILSWYLNFRFLFTVKHKILKDSGIFLAVFILFIATNNSLSNLFWYSSVVCHIFAEMLLFLIIISYVRLFNSSNFEKMKNKGFVYKFLLCCYLLITSFLIGMDTQSTSFFGILIILGLIFYLIKKYKKFYFWYFIPLIVLVFGFINQIQHRLVVVNKAEKINQLFHFIDYLAINLWFGYKYFLIFILGYLVILSLRAFKKITIVNRKDFNISSLFLLGFFMNLSILMYMLYYPWIIKANIIEKRWHTMADVFLALFVLYFCLFLFKEFKNKINKKLFAISLIGIFFIIVAFVNNLNKINYIKNHYVNGFNGRYEEIKKIRTRLLQYGCYELSAEGARKLEFAVWMFYPDNYYHYYNVEHPEHKWIFEDVLHILRYYKIDVNKIKFEGTCDLKDKKVKR